LSPGSRAALPLLTFAVSVFVISFPMMVIALRDFGPATATLVRLLAGGAVLALAARGTFGALHGSVRRIVVIGAFGLGLQSWLLAYAMAHVAAIPALVLGLEPIVIGLVGSIVVREHVAAALSAFAIGLLGEAVIAGFVSGAPAPSGRTARRAHAVVTMFSAYSVSLRQMAALPSAACRAASAGASSRCCRSWRSRLLAEMPFGHSTQVPSRRWHSPPWQRPDSARSPGRPSSLACALRLPPSASTWCRSEERSPATSSSTSPFTPGMPWAP
jgi:hypothetical protein